MTIKTKINYIEFEFKKENHLHLLLIKKQGRLAVLLLLIDLYRSKKGIIVKIIADASIPITRRRFLRTVESKKIFEKNVGENEKNVD